MRQWSAQFDSSTAEISGSRIPGKRWRQNELGVFIAGLQKKLNSKQ